MNRPKVLIVEDDRDLCRALNIRLHAEGFSSAFAEDAIGAISQARKEQPDIILLDLGLPAGDGFVVMDRLQNMPDLATIPIVVLTGRDPRSNRTRALEMGATAFLQKPVDNDELLAALSQALDHTGSSS